MEFTEEKALQIIEQFKLTKSHLNKWRFNKRIPDKYLKGTKNDRKSQEDFKSLKRIMKSNKINVSAICDLATVNRAFIEKFVAGNYTPKPNEIAALKRQINKMKIKVNLVVAFVEKLPRMNEIEAKNIKSILKERLFFVQPVCGSAAIANKINSWVIGKRETFPIEIKDRFLSNLLIFTLELAL